jgi:hypothetical protein
LAPAKIMLTTKTVRWGDTVRMSHPYECMDGLIHRISSSELTVGILRARPGRRNQVSLRAQRLDDVDLLWTSGTKTLFLDNSTTHITKIAREGS